MDWEMERGKIMKHTFGYTHDGSVYHLSTVFALFFSERPEEGGERGEGSSRAVLEVLLNLDYRRPVIRGICAKRLLISWLTYMYFSILFCFAVVHQDRTASNRYRSIK